MQGKRRTTQGEQLGEQLPSQCRTHGVLQQLGVWV